MAEVQQFLQFFEDFLNEMYDGTEGIRLSNTNDGNIIISGNTMGVSANSTYSYLFSAVGIIPDTIWTSASDIVSGATDRFSFFSEHDYIKPVTSPVWYEINTIGLGVSGTADYLELTDIFSEPSTTTSADCGIRNQKISILEKAKRIALLHTILVKLLV